MRRLRTRTLALILGFACATAGPAVSLPIPTTFDGGGSGATADLAVQQAIEDAMETASIFGLYSCVLDGAPAVFESPSRLRPFSAQVTLVCAP